MTPDSFSDGGVNLAADDAVASARRMLAEGAAIVDVGGESTRPGSEGVSLDEELRRVVPVLEQLRGGVPVSICVEVSRALAVGVLVALHGMLDRRNSITGMRPLGIAA